MKWRIYYGDNSTFDSSQGNPEDAPAYNVQIIVQPDKPGARSVGTEALRLHDWYYWRTDEEKWVGGDLHGILDLFLSREPIKALCQGRRIPTKLFDELYLKAKHDPDFPRKSSSHSLETP